MIFVAKNPKQYKFEGNTALLLQRKVIFVELGYLLEVQKILLSQKYFPSELCLHFEFL